MKEMFGDWGKIFLFAATAVPAGALGLHWIEEGLVAAHVTPDIVGVYHMFSYSLLCLDGIVAAGSGLIGGINLWSKQIRDQ